MSSNRPKKDELEASGKKGSQKQRSKREQLELLARTDGYTTEWNELLVARI